MNALSKRASIIGYAAVCLVLAAFLVPTVPGRGWISLAGFSGLATMLLTHQRDRRRRRDVLLSLYFFCIGAHSGGETVWGRHMVWLDDVLLAGTAVVVLFLLWELLQHLGQRSVEPE